MKTRTEKTRMKQTLRRHRTRNVDQELNDALMGTFPASDPVSSQSTLIPGRQDQLPKEQPTEISRSPTTRLK
jgi:hypothetical protein